MGKTYIHLSSRDRRPHETSSEIRVRLSQPIHKAKEVKVVSFTTANEFYNISEGNNAATLNIYVRDEYGVSQIHEEYDILIPAGIYTTAELVSRMNQAITFDPPEADVNMNVQISQDTGHVVITLSSELDYLATLFYKRDIGFYESMWHRLGYTRTQVCGTDTPFNSPGTKYDELPLEAEGADRQFGPFDDAPYEIFEPISELLEDKQQESKSLGFESHSMLYLKSEELVKDSVMSHMNPDGWDPKGP